jgi:serpin B
MALAMTYAGARGETEKQMAAAMQFTLPQDRLHPTLNTLDLELSKRGEEAKGKDGKGFRLNVVNALWGQKDYKFLPAFLDLLAENYGAGLRVLDFQKSPEPSRITINDWVSEQTEDRIKDLIPPGAINDLTRLVLTNAIYFNAAWLHPFPENATANGAFHLLDGKDISVPMMKQTESFGYAEGDSYQAIELPYDGRELSMVILLPKAGQFPAFEKSLDAKLVEGVIGKLQNKRIALTMPRFEFDSSFSLKKALSDLGMGLAFTENADLSGMTGNRELFIHEVLHKAFVAVDEAGTEAAAATAVIVGVTSVPLEPLAVAIDRPFVFLIRDIQTGAILFVGRVVDPS